jgi:hypothetical protein
MQRNRSHSVLLVTTAAIVSIVSSLPSSAQNPFDELKRKAQRELEKLTTQKQSNKQSKDGRSFDGSAQSKWKVDALLDCIVRARETLGITREELFQRLGKPTGVRDIEQSNGCQEWDYPQRATRTSSNGHSYDVVVCSLAVVVDKVRVLGCYLGRDLPNYGELHDLLASGGNIDPGPISWEYAIREPRFFQAPLPLPSSDNTPSGTFVRTIAKRDVRMAIHIRGRALSRADGHLVRISEPWVAEAADSFDPATGKQSREMHVVKSATFRPLDAPIESISFGGPFTFNLEQEFPGAVFVADPSLTMCFSRRLVWMPVDVPPPTGLK